MKFFYNKFIKKLKIKMQKTIYNETRQNNIKSKINLYFKNEFKYSQKALFHLIFIHVSVAQNKLLTLNKLLNT